MNSLHEYKKNIFSQYGEDGIIEKIFEIIGIHSNICIEFGAWDGIHYSNTANLWKNGWQAILIEMNPDRFKELRNNTEGFNCICINEKVGIDLGGTLESLISMVHFDKTKGVDFLSIDIDGDDYYILKSLTHLRPRVICCEYNPTIPLHLNLLPDKNNYFGCSAKSLIALAEEKKYHLVAMSDTNCFFVASEELQNFSDYQTNTIELFDPKYLTFLYNGYDGKVVFSQKPIYGYRGFSNQTFQEKTFCPEMPKSGTHLTPIIKLIKKSKTLSTRIENYLYQLGNYFISLSNHISRFN
jgi:hypothetical protein